ncbi:MAG: hypothetical protein WBB67_04280 [bacterium]
MADPHISYKIKAALLYYWRYTRGFIALPETMVAWWIADIMAYKNGIVCEVEIKTTMPDMKNDINKKGKHEGYAKGLPIEYDYGFPLIHTPELQGMQATLPPNLFYFCVPESMVDKAKEYIMTLNKSYGLLSWRGGDHNIWGSIRVEKKARRLHKELHPEEIIRKRSNYRLSAEVARCYEKLYYKEDDNATK